MAVGFLAWEFMVLQERVRQMERRIKRRQLRDTQNPFALPRNEFMHIFRISPDLAMELINLLRPDLIRQGDGDEANVGIEIQGQGGNEIRQGPRAVAQRIQDQIIRERYGHIPEGNLDAN